MNSNIRTFSIAGVVTVTADISNNHLVPEIVFANGTRCEGFRRTTQEVLALGYTRGEAAKCNYIHECAHLFVAFVFDQLDECCVAQSANGETFETIDKRLTASFEEQTVIGFQIYCNDTLGNLADTAKVQGFNLHIAAAAQTVAIMECDKRQRSITEMKTIFKLMVGSDLFD